MSGFDIFEMLRDGQVLWHRASPRLAEAQTLAAEQAAKTKNSFFILDQGTQERFFFYADGSQAQGSSPRGARSSSSETAV